MKILTTLLILILISPLSKFSRVTIYRYYGALPELTPFVDYGQFDYIKEGLKE